MHCAFGRLNKFATWKRTDHRPLPQNSYIQDGILHILRPNEDAAGLYECSTQFFEIAKVELLVMGIQMRYRTLTLNLTFIHL